MYFRFFKLHDWGKRSGSCRRRFIQGFLYFSKDRRTLQEALGAETPEWTAQSSFTSGAAGAAAARLAFR